MKLLTVEESVEVEVIESVEVGESVGIMNL